MSEAAKQQLERLCQAIRDPEVPVDYPKLMDCLRELGVPEQVTELQEQYRWDGFWCDVSGLLRVLELCKLPLHAELDHTETITLKYGKAEYRKHVIRLPEPLVQAITAMLERRQRIGLE